MKIIGFAYGEFSQVLSLNPNFKPKKKKLKLILDVTVRKNSTDFSQVLKRAQSFFPNLQRHNCCSFEQKEKSCFITVDGKTDLAHLTEHILIDLIAKIKHLPTCSGITCGYFKPTYRFDLFVECPEEKVGRFCSNLAVFLMKRFIQEKEVSAKYVRLIDLVEYLERNSSDINEEKISKDLGLKEKEVFSLVKELRKFQFLQN